MAHWIKVEVKTPEKPEIRQIARRCKCTTAEAFLAFFRLYVWFDSNTDDGHVEWFTKEDADEIGQLPGLGDALEEVRWVMFNQNVTVIANWERHNGESAKKRCLAAERIKRHRESNPEYAAKYPAKAARNAKSVT